MRLLAVCALYLLPVPVTFAQDQRQTLVAIDYRLFYWPRHQEQAAVAAVAAREGLPRLRQALGLAPGPRVDIYLAGTAQEFRRLTGGADPSLVLGQAFPGRRMIVVQPLRGERLRELVVHELTHLLLEDMVAETGAEPPRWLHEGLAKYAAQDFGPADRLLLSQAVNAGKLIPFEDLDKAFAGSPEKVSLAYAEAYTLVDFLANLEPAEGLAPFLRHLGQVGDVSRALLRAYNLTPEALGKQWRQHVLTEYLGRGEHATLTLLWAAMAGLFVIAVVVQLRRSALIRRRLEAAERLRPPGMWDLPGAEQEDEQDGYSD